MHYISIHLISLEAKKPWNNPEVHTDKWRRCKRHVWDTENICRSRRKDFIWRLSGGLRAAGPGLTSAGTRPEATLLWGCEWWNRLGVTSKQIPGSQAIHQIGRHLTQFHDMCFHCSSKNRLHRRKQDVCTECLSPETVQLSQFMTN